MKTYSTLILLLISSSGLWAQTVDELNHSLENTYYMHQGKVEMVDEMLADGKISADSAASWHASLLEEFKNSLLQITMRASEGLWAETVDVDEPEV